jgi:hypothetical protein
MLSTARPMSVSFTHFISPLHRFSLSYVDAPGFMYAPEKVRKKLRQSNALPE